MPVDKSLTVTQACRYFGISERSLRRLLREPDTQALIVAEHRRTATGVRRAAMLPPELILSIEKRLNTPNDSLNAGEVNAGLNNGITLANDGASSERTILSYERLLAEQEAHIADLKAALAHERQQSRVLADALAAIKSKVEANQIENRQQKKSSHIWFGRSSKKT